MCSGWASVRGAEWYAAHGRNEQAMAYTEFAHWFKKLSYEQYMKAQILGECTVHAIGNAFGHSIVGGYDNELPRMQFLIDRDLVKNERANTFWHELLRNQLYSGTKRRPVPYLDKWKKKGHPVLDKFSRNGRPDFNALFWKQLSFGDSHKAPELRTADHVATIVGRRFNGSGASAAYAGLKPCITRKNEVTLIEFNDFDLSSWSYDDSDNPWATEG